ncbi:hypothetical protein MSZK_06040 [Mycobacterium sp. shizuoka-1]|nr:hypothetical protein MSZK_06040 [Mycobacterium sp. shizuoka-1]
MDGVGTESGEPPKPPRGLSRRALGALVAAPITLGIITFVVIGSLSRPPTIAGPNVAPFTTDMGPPAGSKVGVVPDWPMPGSNQVDFSSWARFGAIDARFTDGGRSVMLDTHDTTDTWQTKWSGLIQQGPAVCSFRLTGSVRDVSHTAGVPGGFGIGLADLGPGDPKQAELTGSAVQFDFGQGGYRMAIYPRDDDNGLIPAELDSRWHTVEITVDPQSSSLAVDGRQVATTTGPARCGHPVVRVWAGAAEFADFQFGT